MNTTEFKKMKVALRYWIYGRASTSARWYHVLTAMELSEKYHKGSRVGGQPEFSHQLNIVSFLRTLVDLMEDPVTVLITAFLHDTYEDYPESEDEIKELFPSEFQYIKRVSKIRDGEKIEYKQYFSEMAVCEICSIVKAADRIHNLSTMQGVFKPAKQKKYGDEEIQMWFLPMLKVARRHHPNQEPIYEALKTVLNLQRTMVLNALEGFKSD